MKKNPALYTCIKAMKLKIKYTTWKFTLWKEKILAKVKEKIIELKQKIKSKQTKPVLSNPDVKKQMKNFCWKLFIVIIDKASNNFAFLCRKYYISKLLAEVSPNKNENSTLIYSQTQMYKEEFIKTNIKYCKKFDLKITVRQNSSHNVLVTKNT